MTLPLDWKATKDELPPVEQLIFLRSKAGLFLGYRLADSIYNESVWTFWRDGTFIPSMLTWDVTAWAAI